MKQLVKLLAVSVCAAGLGCGGDSSSDAGGVDTGLSGAKALRDITTSESVSACENVRSGIQTRFTLDDNVRRACEVMGAALTDTPADCQAQVDGCVTQVNEGKNPFFKREQLDFGATLKCDGDVSGFADCDVTVKEYEACLNARIDQSQQLFAKFSCAQAASVDLASAQGFVTQLANPDTPPACERLQTECPQAGPFDFGQN